MKEIIDGIESKLIEIRRTLHKNPELGFGEHKTSEYIAQKLHDLGIETQTGIAKTGVVGLIKGKEGGKTLLLRADIDALPIQEVSNHEYKSQNKGVMHACGHDVHITILLGVADVLSKLKDSFYGNVKLVFQPAEETEGGALPMIEEGIMDYPKVDGAAAYHVWDFPLGTIAVKEGGVTASPDIFKILISGNGGHGAMPDKCINPIEIASRIATQLNSIRLGQSSLVTVCSFQSGTGENIIPDTALLKGTARSTDNATRQKLYEMVTSISSQTAKSLGGSAKVDFSFLYPPTVNDGAMVAKFVRSAEAVIGRKNVIWEENVELIGDDFAYFAQLVPSCYVKLGGAKAPLHTSDFDVDERCIAIGVNIMCRFALDFLEK